MLPQTRNAVAALLKAGLKRKHFRVRTPWNQKVQGYGETRIVLLCPKHDLLQLAPILALSFKTVVICQDSIPMHVSLEAGHGLFLYEGGNEIKVNRLPQASVAGETTSMQPSLWDGIEHVGENHLTEKQRR